MDLELPSQTELILIKFIQNLKGPFLNQFMLLGLQLWSSLITYKTKAYETTMKALILFLFFGSTGFASCHFCNLSILEKQIAFENQYLIVIYDRAPISKGHLLIIPKRHIVKAHELSQEEWGEFENTLPQIVSMFQTILNTHQYLILERNGPYARQTVPHVHFHVIPIPSQKCGDNIKFALFSKVFDIVPAKLNDEELNEEVVFFRNCFNDL